MSAPSSKEVHARLMGDETYSLGGHEVEDVGNASTVSSIPNTLEEVAGKIKVAADSLTE